MTDQKITSLADLPVFLSAVQTCKILGISESSLLRYIKKGKIPHIKLGRRLLLPKEAIELLVKKSFENCEIEYPINTQE